MTSERTSLETYTGTCMDFNNLQAESIKLWDIAQALALTCRFGGHIPRFWSVAEHALLVQQLVIEAGHEDLALAALHHDSHEAYIGDTPKPVKLAAGPGLPRLAARLDLVIAEAFGIDWNDLHADLIKVADSLSLRIEAWHLKPSRGLGCGWIWNEPPPEMRELPQRDLAETVHAFINAHIAYGGKLE